VTPMPLRVGLLATHPIQYYCPWYRSLAKAVDLHVFFSHRQTSEGQAAAGFGVAFDWDVPLLDGYRHTFLRNVSRRPDVSTFFGCNTPELPAIIANESFDGFIVHGWSTYSYWQAMRACWRSGTPVLVRGDSNLATPRSWWRRAVKEPLFRWFIPKFNGYLVVGTRTREYLLAYGADAATMFDAPHAIDNEFFRARADAVRANRAELRRDFGLPEDAVVFLFAGRVIDRKRPDLFIDAVREASMRAPSVYGLMVGDGPQRVQAERRAANAPIRFSGFLNQSEMARAYVAADVLVVPSTWETWGLVVNEAMACGTPAIVSDGVACAGDLVVAGVTGEVFPAGDREALTACLVRCATDRAYRFGLAAGAVERVRRFDLSAATEGTVRALTAVGRRPAAAMDAAGTYERRPLL